MSGVASVKENIQGQDIILKVFEEILKQKLDPIFKETSTYNNLLKIQNIKPIFRTKIFLLFGIYCSHNFLNLKLLNLFSFFSFFIFSITSPANCSEKIKK